MPVDLETNQLIRKRCFGAGSGRGELALETILDDETIPDPTAWLVEPANEEAGDRFGTVYLLGEAGLYRTRASAEIGSVDDPSECACDFIRISREARFALAVVRRWAEEKNPTPGTTPDREVIKTWRFNLGDGEPFEVQTSSLRRDGPAREAFARALATAISGAA